MGKGKSSQFYQNNINNVINYISRNIHKPLSISELIEVAHFSRFHFMRLFKAFTGETLGDFIRRIRIEKGAYFLLYNLEVPITQIALDCGFSSSQNFAKAFKNHYGLSPSQYRSKFSKIPMDQKSNPGNILRTQGKEDSGLIRYIQIKESERNHKALVQLNKSEEINEQVQIEYFKETNTAYVRKLGIYSVKMVSSGLRELVHWARLHQIIKDDTRIFGAFWDNVAVTPDDKCRFDACIITEKRALPGKGINYQTFPAGYYAVYHAEIKSNEFYKHWNLFLKAWFPSSGLELDDRPCLEIYHNFLSGNQKAYKVDICLPIKYP